ncbi:hypothetical protein HK104_001642 [Borealophlyctis nickersoniae]|nr:hypothetical protein HK104_001642 [Borealophlyctis nickersoniae]
MSSRPPNSGSRTLPRDLGKQQSSTPPSDRVFVPFSQSSPSTSENPIGTQPGAPKNKSLKRSMSEVLRRRKSKSDPAVGVMRPPGTEGGRNSVPLTIPRRTDSRDPLASKTYDEFAPEELHTLQLVALKRLNGIFKLCRLKPAPSDLLKTVQNTVYGAKKKWWAPWKKDKDDNGALTVLKTPVAKSLNYASVPSDPEDNKSNFRRIPVLVYECIRFIRANGLKTNGLFRVNGSERRISQLAVQFDTSPAYGMGCSFEGFAVYDVADFLKKYLRGLPEPLFTTDLYPQFLKCLDVPAESGMRIRAVRLLLILLPPPHLVLVECLLELFGEVAANSAQNQMTGHNLARILSPNLLRPKTQKQPLEEYEQCSYIMEFLIDNWDQFIITSKSVRPYQLLDVTYLPRDPLGQGSAPTTFPSTPVSTSAPRIADDRIPSPVLPPEPVELPLEREKGMEPKTTSAEALGRATAVLPGPAVLTPSISRRRTGTSGSGDAPVRRVRTAPTKRTRQLPDQQGLSVPQAGSNPTSTKIKKNASIGSEPISVHRRTATGDPQLAEAARTELEGLRRAKEDIARRLEAFVEDGRPSIVV